MKYTFSILIFCAAGTGLDAQWLKQPTAGIPRTAEGKPNLAAPAPRTPDGHPDLSGYWRRNPKYALDITEGLKPDEVAPWGRALVERRSEDLMKDHMGVLCLPAGPAYATISDMKIIQTPTLLAMLNSDLTFRQIHMDGRTLEADPNPAWMGYSIGRWEEDTLVVESNGYNDRTWLDGVGHPHTEALRTIERYRRLSVGRMELQLTLEDPKVYAKPWTLKIDMFLAPDTEMLEYVCNENERDREHLIGKASDERKRAITLAPEVLAKYAGNYRIGAQVTQIKIENGKLVLSFSGFPLELTPLSETLFTSPYFGGVDFTKDASGAITGFAMDGGVQAARVR